MRRILPFAVALLLPGLAQAQSAIVLWPTDPLITKDEQATGVWLENHGKQPVTLQIRAHDWAQGDGGDRETATQAVVSSPPIATIAPGQRQLVRVIRRGPAASGESSYRLLVDELPQPAPEGGNGVVARLAVQMRYSLPLFAYGSDPAGLSPQLSSAVRLIDGKRWLEISNRGGLHARLTDLRAGAGAGARVLRDGLIGYVLPGATMRWPLPNDFTAGQPLTVAVNGADVPLSPSA